MGFFRLNVPVDDPRFGKPIRCQNPVHLARRVSALSSLSTLHPDDLKLRLSNIRAIEGTEAMLEACKRLLKHPYGWLYIYGGSGNAKTVALKALCNHLSLQGYSPVVYIKFTQLVDFVKSGHSEAEARAQYMKQGIDPENWPRLGHLDRINQLKQVKVLAIEEFDKESITGYVERFRFDFLDDRYDQAWRGETITLFAAQSSPDELPDALRSRFSDGRFIRVENKAGDARPDMERDESIIVKPVGY